MINKRNYLNYVTMIDSECDSQRNQPMLSTNSSFYRSPLRDRENRMNISNTPLRSGKASLSPLRMRKNQANNQSNISLRTTLSKRKPLIQQEQQQQICFNHPQKNAKFYIEANDQKMYCCQKCAILLASQGFKVCKLQNFIEQSSRKDNNPRKIEIQNFMNKLQVLMNCLRTNQAKSQQKFTQGQVYLQQQLNKIQDYYEEFYEILNQHKKRVIAEVKDEYTNINSQAFIARKQIKQAIQQTESMKKDILDSWEDIIFVAQEKQYRPVINAYYEKLDNYQKFSRNNQDLPNLQVRKLNFKNANTAHEALQKSLQVEWQDEQKDELECAQQKQQSEIDMAKYSKSSDLPQNPVEYLQKQQKQKFIKSSLKDLVGLFSSFEQ